jgi:hypothetical protein
MTVKNHFFLKVNTARETPAVKYIKRKREEPNLHIRPVWQPQGGLLTGQGPRGQKGGDNKLTIYQTY